MSTGNKVMHRDPTTADMFLEGLTDKQLARAVHSKKFIADYNGLVSAQNPANQSSGAWVSHMVEWLKKDPSNFTKRRIQEYLDDEQAPLERNITRETDKRRIVDLLNDLRQIQIQNARFTNH